MVVLKWVVLRTFALQRVNAWSPGTRSAPRLNNGNATNGIRSSGNLFIGGVSVNLRQ